MHALQAVGLWRILGVTLHWEELGAVRERSWSLEQLADGLRGQAVALVDVREDREWQAGHVRGSRHLPLVQLGNGRALTAPAPAGTVAVACAGGMRAAFAASLLRRGGWGNVMRIAGGGIAGLPAQGIGLVGGTA